MNSRSPETEHEQPVSIELTDFDGEVACDSNADGDKCPDCGGEITFGFGLACGVNEDGEPKGYHMCLDCDWVDSKPSHMVCFPHGIVEDVKNDE